MIKNTFLLLDGVSVKKEKSLWKQGVKDWNEFVFRDDIKGINNDKKRFFNRQLTKASNALSEGNSEFFAKLLPKTEHWRLYEHFKNETVFLDIEASDCSEGFVTVIGLFDGYNTKTMIQGVNLDFEALKEELKKYKMIVSFNGSVFDVPFLKKRYPNLIPEIPHFDLRFCCQKLGIKGGLKEVEKSFGMQRRELVGKLRGGDCITLWRMWRASNDDYYLKLLIEYNEEDCVNLKFIADKAYEMMKKQLTKNHLTTSALKS